MHPGQDLDSHSSTLTIKGLTGWIIRQTQGCLCVPSHITLHECRPTHCLLHFPLSSAKTTYYLLSPLVYQPPSISSFLCLSLTLFSMRCESRGTQQNNSSWSGSTQRHEHAHIIISILAGKPLHALTPTCLHRRLLCVQLFCLFVCDLVDPDRSCLAQTKYTLFSLICILFGAQRGNVSVWKV